MTPSSKALAVANFVRDTHDEQVDDGMVVLGCCRFLDVGASDSSGSPVLGKYTASIFIPDALFPVLEFETSDESCSAPSPPSTRDPIIAAIYVLRAGGIERMPVELGTDHADPILTTRRQERPLTMLDTL